MADEYIRKQDAVEALDELRVNSLDAEKGLLLLSGIAAASDIIESLEPADVVPLVHGEWINEYWHSETVRKCSVCHITQTVNVYEGKVKFNYCPYCGAKMDGEECGHVV